MIRIAKDLRQFIESLNSAKVEYLVVGSFALAYHGCPRYTGAWRRRETALLDGIEVHFMDRAELIKNKRATGRPRDLADLQALEETAP